MRAPAKQPRRLPPVITPPMVVVSRVDSTIRAVLFVSVTLAVLATSALPQSARAQGSRVRSADAVVAPAPACVSHPVLAERTAFWAAPLDRIVSIRQSDAAMREILDQSAALAQIELSYSAEMLPKDRRLCVAFERVAIGAVLETLLAGTGIRPVVVGPTQVVLAPPRADGEAVLVAGARRASVLDRVVVTGTPDGASQRGSPFALDVIEGATLTKHRTASLADALDMAVPGLWSWATAAGSVTARYGSIRGASSFGVSAPKIYLDGIEVANPLLVTQLDPSRVERVEVIRGPQGAALYGADAISGVVNILTRHDGTPTGATQVQFATSAGVSATSYAPRDAFVQDHTVSLRSGTSKRSAGFGLSVGTLGAYVPGASERRVLADADLRVVRSRTVLTGTARFSLQRANASSDLLLGGFASALNAARAPANGVSTSGFFARLEGAPFNRIGGGFAAADTGRPPVPRDTLRFAGDSAGGQNVSQYTIGGTATMMPSLRWTNTVIAGVDGYRMRGLTNAGLPTPNISAADLTSAFGAADRTSLRLRSVGRFELGERTSLSMTFAAEQAILRMVEDQSGQPMVVRSGTPPSSLSPAGTSASRVLQTSWAQNGGVLAQANLAYRDAWFLVAGGRIERSTGVAPEAQVELLPMLGASYVRDLGSVVLKGRVAYGTGIRPVQSLTRGTSWMGRGALRAASALEPESQSGVESGVDLLVGRALQLRVTRFDQRASGLIQPVAVTTSTQLPGGRWLRTMSYVLENVGAITNRGWELQASTQGDHLALAGTWSTVDSRVDRVAMGYRGDLRAGDRMLDVPARTASVSASWSASRWAAGATLARAADWIGYDRLAIGQALGNALGDPERERQLSGALLRNFWVRYEGVTRARANLTYRVAGDVTLQLTGDNLLNVQRGAPDNATVTAGRTLSLGLRTSF